jgi:hypothetical protein
MSTTLATTMATTLTTTLATIGRTFRPVWSDFVRTSGNLRELCGTLG